MSNDSAQSASGPGASNEEPELGFEESIPSDGGDPIGEKMIDELGSGHGAKEESPRPPKREAMARQS